MQQPSHKVDRAAKQRRTLALWLIAGNVVVALALIAASILTLRASREADEDAARMTTQNLASSLSIEIAAELKLIDNSLASVASLYRRTGIGRDNAVVETLAEQRHLLKHVAALRITDANGNVLHGLGADAATLNIADRDYFRLARGSAGMVVSEPLQSRATGQWGIIVARRLLSADGEFGGIAYALFTSTHIAKRFSQLDVGPSGAIYLRDDALRLVARYSPVQPDSQQGLGGTQVSDEYLRQRGHNPERGSYITVTPLDGIERMMAYQRVDGSPLVVLAGLATESFFQAWRSEVMRQTVLVCFIILVMATFSAVLFRRQCREREARFAATTLAREQNLMLENDLIGMMRTRDRVTVWENKAADRIFGYAPGQMRGLSARRLYLDDAAYDHVGAVAYAALSDSGTFRTQLQLRRNDGTAIWIDLSATRVSDEDCLWMMVDIDALKRSEEQAQALALRDPLTGLPNRRLFEEKAQDALARARRSGCGVVICYLDLNGFKPINDAYGHEAGDLVLRTVGQRLRERLRDADVVARLGGDEFALIVGDAPSVAAVTAAIELLLLGLAGPILIGDSPAGSVWVKVDASAGLIWDNGQTPVSALLRAADESMYRAKRSGQRREIAASLCGDSSAPVIDGAARQTREVRADSDSLTA